MTTKDARDVGCFGLTFATILIGLVLLVGAISIGVWGVRVYTAEIKGRGDAHIQINSAQNRIGKNDRFYAVCKSVQDREATIDALTAQRETATTDQQRARIDQNLSANHAARAEAINEYNAMAANGYTTAQFQAANLPYRLSDESYTGERTRCAS